MRKVFVIRDLQGNCYDERENRFRGRLFATLFDSFEEAEEVVMDMTEDSVFIDPMYIKE